MNTIKEKILLLLLGGIAFGYSYTPGKQWMILKTISREWKKLDKKELKGEIGSLYRFKFIDKKKNNDGSVRVLITEKGKLKALNCQFENLKNRKEKWDGKWRMVAFDIPEKFKRGRDALRERLKRAGFRELQKSVFILPYDCEKEISSLVDFFDLSRYIRFGVLELIDNEVYLKKIFKLV
ncbi:MAG: PaaX family transcrtiptional regulator [Parcubacteria group bacterium Licking1014_1]|nr:MAG: PaaX family transcrtiptional regulator [Parcubacteria group bacterium Licking1014_1]